MAVCLYCNMKDLEDHGTLMRESPNYRKGYSFALRTVGRVAAKYIESELEAGKILIKQTENK